jgi:polyhydroxybutyrate depolymerase
MRRTTTALVLAALLAACSSSGDTATPPTTSAPTTTTTPACTVASQPKLARINLKIDGDDRFALVHVPARWDGETPVPVVLSFHGLGSTAEQQRASDGFVGRSDNDNFIVVYPQAGNRGSVAAAWDLRGDTDLRFVRQILDTVEARECVDTSRVYSTGLSYGGAMTDMLACELSDRIAAAAPVSAYLPQRDCAPPRPVPILSFHGVEDQLLPYDGTGPSGQRAFEAWGADWAQRNGCAAKPTTTQIEPTVEELSYANCKEPVALYRLHHSGHTWPGHPLGLDRRALIDYFSGKTTGKPFPLMVALGLTPEQFADTISLANTDIDASSMILAFFRQHRLAAS